MDVNVVDQVFDATALFQKLVQQFPNKELDTNKQMDFRNWKLNDLKSFLKVTNNFKGLSKAKKEEIVFKVHNVWSRISGEFMFNKGDISDSDLLSLNLPSPSSTTTSFLSPPCSPSSLPSPSSTTTSFLFPQCSPSSLASPSFASTSITAENYPNTVDGMELSDFKKWTIPQLSQYLVDRCINKSGNKEKLVQNVYGAYLQKLPVIFTDPQQEKEEITQDIKSKLILENGMLTLPNPDKISNDWILAPSNLPDTTFSLVENYLRSCDAGKAFKGGKSLLLSGHLSNVMVHMISPNVRYCFVRGLCRPEQKLSKSAYNVWVCLHKDNGTVENGHCSCTAGVSGCCKHVGALLWYVEQEVRLGHNKTCTMVKQKWSVPSIRQQQLHQPDTVENISMSKPKAKRILGLTESPTKIKTMRYDPRKPSERNIKPLKSNDIDTLAEITNGKCGLVVLMRQATEKDDLQSVACFEEVETTPCNLPNINLIDEIAVEGSNFDSFLERLSITFEEQKAVEQATSGQSKSEAWFGYRKNRITASKFREAVHKVGDDGNIINPNKCRTLVSKVCSYSKHYETKATKWGIDNEPVARKLYVKLNKSKHRKFIVTEPGFFIDIQYPFIGASPDGIVSCECHGEGILEIKCPWASRDLKIIDYAAEKNTCLELISGKVALKKTHPYYYQVQCQMKCTNLSWCDFFVCTSKDNFLERIYYDKGFMEKCILKASIYYEKVIYPEVCNRKIFDNLEIERCVKEVMSALLDECEAGMDIDFEMNI